MGSGYEKRLRSKFPNGVTGVRGAFEPFEENPTQ